MYICVCNAVSDREIRQVVYEGASTLQQVHAKLPVGRCCGRCVDAVREVIEECRAADSMRVCFRV